VPRRRQFADFLGRLATDEVPSDFSEFDDGHDYRSYIFNASDLLEGDATFSLAQSQVVPDGYRSSDFTVEEIEAMKASPAEFHIGNIVYRNLHGRQLFVVPAAKLDELWLTAHIGPDGLHRHLATTNALLSHMTWPRKFQDIRARFGLCECQAARGNRGLKPLRFYSGQAARPGAFGDVVFFDQKSYPTHTGRQYLGTALDKASGLVKAILIDGPTGEAAQQQVTDFLSLGRPIAAAVFDAHRSYLNDNSFREFLESKGIMPYFSKTDDPRYISDLESVHNELNVLIRSLPDPWEWTSHLDSLLEAVNSNPQASGVSRAGMALGHSPVETHAIARRHRSLLQAQDDAKEPGPAPFKPGDKAKLDKKFKSVLGDPFELITIVECDHTKALIVGGDARPRYVATRLLRPLSAAARNAPASVGAANDPDIDEAAPAADAPLAADAPPVAPPVAVPAAPAAPVAVPAPAPIVAAPVETNHSVDDWAILVEAQKPWFGVITKMERDGQVWIHQFDFARKYDPRSRSPKTPLGAVVPVWVHDDGRLKHAREKPAGNSWKAAVYLCSDTTILTHHKRVDKFELPTEALRSIANYARNLR